MKVLGVLVFCGALMTLTAALVGGCYPHTAPTPCVNIENCGDPTQLPPVHDRIARDGGIQ